MAEFTGRETAQIFKQSLKAFIPSNATPIVINGVTSGPAAPAAAAPAAQTAPAGTADVNLTSDPPARTSRWMATTLEAREPDRTVAGTHSITITKTGYVPWVGSVVTRSGENRNIAAQLDRRLKLHNRVAASRHMVASEMALRPLRIPYEPA